MRTLSYNITIAIAVMLALAIAQPAWAQTCGGPREPDPTTTLSTASFPEIAITLHKGWDGTILSGSVDISAEDIRFSFDFAPQAPYQVGARMSNGEDVWDMSAGVIKINCFGSYGREGRLELGPMPSDARTLWERSMGLVGELMDNPAFWEFLNAGEYETQAREQLGSFPDGTMSPYVQHQYAAMAAVVNMLPTGGLGRGYTINLPNQMTILTSDPVGAENPVLYIDVWPGFRGNPWSVRLDPETQTCEISRWSSNSDQPLTSEEWNPRIEEIVRALEFLKAQMPSYIDGGIIEEDSELPLFVDKGLDWLGTFTRTAGGS